MHRVEPKVFLVAEPSLLLGGMEDADGLLLDYLRHIGAPDWRTDAVSEAEELVEVAGRLCYRSFAKGLNANVTKIREGNAAYMANILSSRHGSCLEHAQVTFIFQDVSRVFTHEVIRHRVGVGISQESLRFVRLTDLGLWLPSVIASDPEATAIFEETFKQLEALQLKLAEHFKLDDEGVPFHRKKEITSAMRRIAPIGLATAICWSANFRTLRWVIELRTDAAAEEEIRLVFDKVAQIVTARYPAAFSDFEKVPVEGSSIPAWKPKNQKV